MIFLTEKVNYKNRQKLVRGFLCHWKKLSVLDVLITNSTAIRCHRALELALWAPNHKMTCPWAFYDIGLETRQKLVSLAIDLKKLKTPDLSDAMEFSLRGKLESVSHMIMIGLKLCDDDFQLREDYATVSCGVQNMSLYLHDQGYGSKWSTGGFTRHEKAYEILEVNPAKVEIVGAFLVGCIDKSQELRVPPRPDSQETIHCLP